MPSLFRLFGVLEPFSGESPKTVRLRILSQASPDPPDPSCLLHKFQSGQVDLDREQISPKVAFREKVWGMEAEPGSARPSNPWAPSSGSEAT